jgi:hypothetical protein
MNMTPVAQETLQKGSRWSHGKNVIEEITKRFVGRIVTPENQQWQHAIARSGSVTNSLQINCYSDGKLSRKQCKCQLGLTFRVLPGCTDPTIGEITYCNVNHSSNCVVKNGSGRKRNAPIKQRCLEGENDGFTKGLVLHEQLSSSRTSHGKLLCNGIAKNNEGDMNIQQAYKYCRQVAKDTFTDHIADYTRLPALLMELQRLDPTGIYYLESKPLGDEYKKQLGIEDNIGREFVSVIIIPSYLFNSVWNSDSKIHIMDYFICH